MPVIPTVILAENSDTGKRNLLAVTMKADIDTATYYDLYAWAQGLGLPVTGTKNELRKSLYQYYSITNKPETPLKKGNLILIESAKGLQNLKIEKNNENYIIISGNVHLEMSDNKNKTTHDIYADKIIFNQPQKTITAEGSITYSIQQNNTTQFFYGDSLTFNVESWEGMFFKGVSEKKKKINGNDVFFYFSGKEIYRKKGDKVILVKGEISSKKGKNPPYHLTADKIWVLNPGEWAIKNPVLYVGRIPVFAFPFLFMPGDKLIFHPIYGIDDKNGYFINTTTYLIGQKPDNSQNTLSFLQSGSSEGDTVLKRDGLFLRKTSVPLPKGSSSLKFMADYYTRKGFLSGIDGSFQNIGIIKSLTIFGGVGFTRSIYKDPLYGYTPYVSNNNYQSLWEKSYFFGKIIPFRFGFDLGSNVQYNAMNFILSLPFYSDPAFKSDFFNRKEDFDFQSLTNGISQNNTSIKSSDISLSSLNNLSWDATISGRVDTKKTQPLVQTASLDKLNFGVSFQSNDIPDSNTPVVPLKFYYPQHIVYPDLSATLKGELFSFNTIKKKISKDISGKDMISPWEKSQPEQSNNSEDVIIPPDISQDIPLPVSYNYGGISHALSYSIIPHLTMSSVLNSTVPLDPDLTETVPDYSVVSFQNTATMLYALSVSDKLFTLNTKVDFTTNYLHHFSPSDSFTGDWNIFTNQDKVNDSYALTNTTVIKSYPLVMNQPFSESFITYTITSLLFNHAYNQSNLSFENIYPQWDSQSIKNHQVTLSAVYKPRQNSHSVDVTMILPPYDPEIYPSIINTWENFNTKISTGFKKNKNLNTWDIDPLLILGKYSVNGLGYLSQTVTMNYNTFENVSTTDLSLQPESFPLTFKELFTYNLTHKDPQKSVTTLNAGIFTSSFSMEKTYGYTFNPVTGWNSDSVEKFQPTQLAFGLKYTYNPDPLWKNRIRLNADVTSSWSMNILKPTDTALNFDLGFSFSIAEFLELQFKSESVNRAMYRYFPSLSDEIGLSQTINPFTDLLKSFNIFNKKDRIASNFNLSLLEINAVHHLGDWDLTLKYTGKPEIVSLSDLSKEYQWRSNVSLYLTWKPIPEIKKEIDISNEEVAF